MRPIEKCVVMPPEKVIRLPMPCGYHPLGSCERWTDPVRLQELGYIRSGSDLTNVYNDVTVERVILFQRQIGITEDGVASQELQAYLFSEKAPVCGQKLPKVRSRVVSQEGSKRIFCGCCMGEGCECCHFTGWIDY